MNKEWFVLIDGYHKGPFSLKELEEMYRFETLLPDTMIWREGSASWSKASKVMESLEKARLAAMAKKGITPPKAPAVSVAPPPIPKELEAVKKQIHKIENESLVTPPPIPLDVLLNPYGRDDIFNESSQKQRELQAKYKLVFSIAIILAFFGIATWFATHESKSNIQIKARGVMPVYIDRMQDAAQTQSADAIVSLALAMDGKSIFAAINKDENMTVEMTLTPVPKRVMGVSDVEIQAVGEMSAHMGEFSKIKFLKGSQFFPGEYNVHFKGKVSSKLLQKAQVLKNIEALNALDKVYDVKFVALLYSGTPREFEKKIIEYQEKVTEEQLTPLYSKLESVKTFQSLLNKMMEDYVKDLYKIKKGKEISTFESRYVKEISPIIQSMMVEALESNKELKLQQNQLQSRSLLLFQERLVLYGKNIGELASDMITETEKTNNLNDSKRSELRNKFEVRYKVIKDALGVKITELEQQIDDFKSKI